MPFDGLGGIEAFPIKADGERERRFCVELIVVWGQGISILGEGASGSRVMEAFVSEKLSQGGSHVW